MGNSARTALNCAIVMLWKAGEDIPPEELPELRKIIKDTESLGYRLTEVKIHEILNHKKTAKK